MQKKHKLKKRVLVAEIQKLRNQCNISEKQMSQYVGVSAPLKKLYYDKKFSKIANDYSFKTITNLKQNLQVQIKGIQDKNPDRFSRLIKGQFIERDRYQPNIQPGDEFKFVKRLEKRRMPYQIIKLVIKMQQLGGEIKIEEMTTHEFLGFSDMGSDTDYYLEILEVITYSFKLRGGCTTRTKYDKLSINGHHFKFQSLKSKDNNCLIACFEEYKHINFTPDEKKVFAKTLRKKVLKQDGNEQICIDDIQKFVDYYNLFNVRLYYLSDDKIAYQEFKIEKDVQHTCEILLMDQHYYYVTDSRFDYNGLTQKAFEIEELLQNKLDCVEYDCARIKLNENEMEYDQIVEQTISTLQQWVDEENQLLLVEIQGMGGTGKSNLCNTLINTFNEKIIPTAMTGKASLLLKNGQTTHSLLYRFRKSKKEGHDKIILIDECSMVSGQFFDEMLQTFKNCLIVLVGDLYQLPPIEQDIHGFYFESYDFRDYFNRSMQIMLHKNKRVDADQEEFQQVLREIRLQKYDNLYTKFIEKHTANIYQQSCRDDELYLSYTNSVCDAYNSKKIEMLQKNGAESFVSQCVETIDMKVLEELFKTEEKIKQQYAILCKKLKKNKTQTFYVGQRVMITKNDMQNGVSNGSIGIIQKFDNEKIHIQILDQGNDQIYVSEKQIKRKSKVSTIYSHKYYLRSAYAITFHKIQGATLRSKVFINFYYTVSCFALYTAVSRVVDCNLMRFINTNYITQQKMEHYHNNCLKVGVVQNYINNDKFQPFLENMDIQIDDKKVQINKKSDIQLVSYNQIEMDFETAEKFDQDGFCFLSPYENNISIISKLDDEDKPEILDYQVQDYDQNCAQSYNEDVAERTIEIIFQQIHKYEEKIRHYRNILKSGLTNEQKLICKNKYNILRQRYVRLITHNGGGFDLHFILKKLYNSNNIKNYYSIEQINKGSTMIILNIRSKELGCTVLSCHDTYQLTQLSLENASKAFLNKEQKINFKKKIMFISKYRYINPSILSDEIQTVTSNGFITFIDNQQYKKDFGDEWTIQKQSLNELLLNTKGQQMKNRTFQVDIETKCYLKKEMQEYAKQDTNLLRKICEVLDEKCYKMMGISIFNFYTNGSACFQAFLYNLPKIVLQDNTKYDKNRNSKFRNQKGLISTQLYFNELKTDNYNRQAIQGGLCNPRQKYFNKQTQLDLINNPEIFEKRYEQVKHLFSREELKHNMSVSVYCDISGMYGAEMLNRKYPYSEYSYMNKEDIQLLLIQLQKITCKSIYELKDLNSIVSKEIEKLGFLAIFKCDIQNNPQQIEPTFSVNKILYSPENEKKVHDLKLQYKNSDDEYEKNHILRELKQIHQTTNKRRIFTNSRQNNVFIDSVRLLTLLCTGGKLYNIHCCMKYNKMGYILRDFITLTQKMKDEGTQLKKIKAKEEKKLKKMQTQISLINQFLSNESQNQIDFAYKQCKLFVMQLNDGVALRSYGKMNTNSLYGQTLMQDKQSVTRLINDREEMELFIEECSWENVFMTQSEQCVVVGQKIIDRKDFISSRCCYLGVFVLSYSHLTNNHLTQTFNPEQLPYQQASYTDTDSHIVRKDLVIERLVMNGLIRDQCGYLTDELNDDFFQPPKNIELTEEVYRNPKYYHFSEVQTGIFVQPKTLAVEYLDYNTQKLKQKFRCKGISVNSIWGINREKISYELMVQLFNSTNETGIAQTLQLPSTMNRLTPNKITKELQEKGSLIDTKYHTHLQSNKYLLDIIPAEISRKIFNCQYLGRQEQGIYYVPHNFQCEFETEKKIQEYVDYDDDKNVLLQF